jgi:hypothetical protein
MFVSFPLRVGSLFPQEHLLLSLLVSTQAQPPSNFSMMPVPPLPVPYLPWRRECSLCLPGGCSTWVAPVVLHNKSTPPFPHTLLDSFFNAMLRQLFLALLSLIQGYYFLMKKSLRRLHTTGSQLHKIFGMIKL